eukprot:39011-Eustigmatos_ZCMA.PRE.1
MSRLGRFSRSSRAGKSLEHTAACLPYAVFVWIIVPALLRPKQAVWVISSCCCVAPCQVPDPRVRSELSG